jgi:hypothetical protein
LVEKSTRRVVCSNTLVEATGVQAKSGVVNPLFNGSERPIYGLTVTVCLDVPQRAESASGRPLTVSGEKGQRVFTLDLDVQDAIYLR